MLGKSVYPCSMTNFYRKLSRLSILIHTLLKATNHVPHVRISYDIELTCDDIRHERCLHDSSTFWYLTHTGQSHNVLHVRP